jgi:hypothetical protein
MKNRTILNRIYVCLFCVFSVSLLAPKANAALINGSESRLTLHNDGGGEYAIFLNREILGVLDRPSLLEVFKNLDFVNLFPDFKKPFAESFKQLFNMRKAHVDLYWLLALFAPYNHDNELLVRSIASIVFFGLKSSQVFQELRKFHSDKIINLYAISAGAGIFPLATAYQEKLIRDSRLDDLISPEDVLVNAKLFAEYVRRIEEYRSRTISRSVGYGYVSHETFKAHQNIGLESDD